MTKNLFMITLLVYSCTSSNDSSIELKKDTVNHAQYELSQMKKESEKEIVDSSFLSFWKEFTIAVKTKNYSAFRGMSLDNIKYEEKNTDINSFIQAHFSEIFDDSLVHKFNNIAMMDFLTDQINASDISPQYKEGKYLVQEVHIDKLRSPDLMVVELKFIKTKNGYKFYRYDRFG